MVRVRNRGAISTARIEVHVCKAGTCVNLGAEACLTEIEVRSCEIARVGESAFRLPATESLPADCLLLRVCLLTACY